MSDWQVFLELPRCHGAGPLLRLPCSRPRVGAGASAALRDSAFVWQCAARPGRRRAVGSVLSGQRMLHKVERVQQVIRKDAGQSLASGLVLLLGLGRLDLQVAAPAQEFQGTASLNSLPPSIFDVKSSLLASRSAARFIGLFQSSGAVESRGLGPCRCSGLARALGVWGRRRWPRGRVCPEGRPAARTRQLRSQRSGRERCSSQPLTRKTCSLRFLSRSPRWSSLACPLCRRLRPLVPLTSRAGRPAL